MLKSLLHRAQRFFNPFSFWRMKLFLRGKGQVYRSDNGDVVQIVSMRRKNSAGLNDCLVRLKGRTARKRMLDNQVFLAKSNPDGTGVRLSIALGDKDFAVAQRNQNLAIGNRMLFFFGEEQIDLFEDQNESKNLEVNELYLDYQQKIKSRPEAEPEN